MSNSDRMPPAGNWVLLLIDGCLGCFNAARTATPESIDFDRDIRPIFENSCLRCHGPERPRGGFRLDNREAALRGGDYGPVLLPGNSAESLLIAYVAHEEPGMEMPPIGQGDPLTPDQVTLLRAWIDQGAEWPATSLPSRRLRVDSSVQWIGVEGNQDQFRAHTSQQDGWSGGFTEFDYEEWLDADTSLQAEGRSLMNQGDYGLTLELRRRDLGFARVEVETWRSYDDVHGWYYAPYAAAPSLDRQLETRHGRAGLTLGWTPRRWPQFTVGYEYRWREGGQSSLSWGMVSPDPLTDPGKAIQPGWVALEEAVHRWTLEIEKSWNTGLVADQLYVELYDRQSQGTYPGDSAADLLGRYREDYDHRQVVNVLRAENQFNDWLFLSGGYLFSHLEGDGAIGQSLESLTGAFPPFPGDATPALVVRHRSHTFNANALAGAWQGFRLTGGLQSEWQNQDGLGQWIAPGFPNPNPGYSSSGQDRLTLDQTVGLQYDRLPYTVLHAEGRWQQQWVDHRESALLEDGFADTRDFERHTDGQGRRRRYGLGATLSPWTPVSLDAGYRWESRATTYDHRTDRDGSPDPATTGNGYPAFIRSRVIEGDEVDLRVAWRVVRGLRLTVKYSYGRRDIRSDTDPSLVPAFPDPVFYPGGHILSGQETAHSASAGFTWLPWNRLQLSSSLTTTDSRLETGADDGAILAPYDGQVVSVLSSASLILNRSTDLRIHHSSCAGTTTAWPELAFPKAPPAVCLLQMSSPAQTMNCPLAATFASGSTTALPDRQPPACDFAEARVWSLLGGGWHCLHGCYCQRGLSVEWHDFECSKPRDWARSFHPNSVEVCLNLSGHARLSRGDTTAMISPMSLGFYAVGEGGLAAWRLPGERHQFLTLEFSPTFLDRHLKGHEPALHRVLRSALGPQIDPVGISTIEPLPVSLRKWIETVREPDVAGAAQGLWYESKALELIARLFFNRPDLDHPLPTRRDSVATDRVARLVEILGENLTEPPSLKELGRRIGCSPYHLSRTFSREMGMTLPQYLRQIRMERAAELLKSGRFNVTEAALEVGYSSLSHFSHAFCEVMGCCPGLYPLGLVSARPRPLPQAGPCPTANLRQ